jgi:catechol 2,3-dioxygenase-like lactoylglutathione lyase family enzyme
MGVTPPNQVILAEFAPSNYERINFSMSHPNPNQPVLQLRVALTVADYERSIKFYCDGLGIEPAALWNNGQGRALVLDMGNATLEIFDEAQAETIDQIEAEQRISGQIRFALQVPDVKAAMERLIGHGATLIHPRIITPWGDYNVRLQDPDGIQITLFQVPVQNEPDQP